jgi:hypothetical protein
MHRGWNAVVRILFSAVAITTALSCSLFTPAPAGHTSVVQPNTAAPQDNSFAPLPTAASVKASADQINIDYTYTSQLITVIYPLYGSILDDFVTVEVGNDNSETARVIVESEIVGYTDKATDTVDVDPGETVEVRQNPRLIPAVIDTLNVGKPASFHIRVVNLQQGEARVILDQTDDVNVYARRDFPWSIEGFTEQEDFELLTSMVTPNDPAVEALIRDAANYSSTGTMWDGYGGHVDDDDGGVWDRLEAIWKAEAQDHHLTFISTLISFAPGEVQRVRLPYEVLDQQSGNCIELSLLFASATEALHLETALLRIPGHVFMAVRKDQENAKYYVIETTMIGKTDFADAVSKGSEEFYDALSHIQDGEQYYDWVTISDAREKGILPLPWH